MFPNTIFTVFLLHHKEAKPAQKAYFYARKNYLYILCGFYGYLTHVLQQVDINYSPALDVGLNYTELLLLFSSWLQISGCYACVN